MVRLENDLYRYFAIGFGGGAVIVLLVLLVRLGGLSI